MIDCYCKDTQIGIQFANRGRVCKIRKKYIPVKVHQQVVIVIIMYLSEEDEGFNMKGTSEHTRKRRRRVSNFRFWEKDDIHLNLCKYARQCHHVYYDGKNW